MGVSMDCSECGSYSNNSCGDSKTITGWRKFDTAEKPFGPIYNTEDEAWKSGSTPYNGMYEVYPICR